MGKKILVYGKLHETGKGKNRTRKSSGIYLLLRIKSAGSACEPWLVLQYPSSSNHHDDVPL